LSGRRLDVKQAAEILGISSEGVRKRIKRGKLESEKDTDGKVYVWLDEDRTGPDKDQTSPDERSNGSDNAELIEALRDQIAILKSEAEAWREEAQRKGEESRRKDHLLAAALERIPAIEPPPDTPAEPRESPTPSSEDGNGIRVPPEPEKPISWWRRLFSL